MKNEVYIHKNKGINILVKVILSLLVIFFAYGLYKNGIRGYLKGYGSVYNMLLPAIYLGLSLVVSFIYANIFKERFISYNLLSNVLIALVTIPNTNLILYIALLVGVNLLTKFIKINPVALYMSIIITSKLIMGNLSFLNIYEKSVEHIYVFMDYILGFGFGGVGNTFLIFTLISFLVLLSFKEYKKEIPVLAFLVYYALLLIKLIFVKNLDSTFFLNNNLIFAFIFIAPISLYSPYSKGACYIYGILLGIISFAFSFFNLDLGVYLSILILSFLAKYFDKFITGS